MGLHQNCWLLHPSLFLQGFSQLNLTPFEAGRVLAQAAHHLGLPQIPDEYLKEGHLGEILIPEDYKPLQNVSKANYTSH